MTRGHDTPGGGPAAAGARCRSERRLSVGRATFRRSPCSPACSAGARVPSRRTRGRSSSPGSCSTPAPIPTTARRSTTGDRATSSPTTPSFSSCSSSTGSGRGDGGPWYRTLAPDHPTPAELIGGGPAARGRGRSARRTRLLLANGADPNGRGLHPGCTGGRHGLRGRRAVRERRGGRPADRRPGPTRTRSTLHASSSARAWRATGPRCESMMQADPSLLDPGHRPPPGPDRPGRERAARTPSGSWSTWVSTSTPASGPRPCTRPPGGATSDSPGVLIELGADPSITDTEHHSTPRGWAEYGGHGEMAAYLARLES